VTSFADFVHADPSNWRLRLGGAGNSAPAASGTNIAQDRAQWRRNTVAAPAADGRFGSPSHDLGLSQAAFDRVAALPFVDPGD
jgi:hypothetical protein